MSIKSTVNARWTTTFNHDLEDEKEEIKFSDLELIFKDLKSLFEKRGYIINWKALEKQSLMKQ